ncbi:hypothetical protein LTR56_003887 [Elasticomyces elasticus]|nr:hypothetical protein LTR22_022562 [Elasticomyces elasticus]KAK3654614.1 hypothetical protein LTR56_003887 [Elasticomyces elasticus]KAK4908006.1 hypothetical protein LTR49_023037 [Elasticomyces elasticus]KAK5755242.1 hypothetical protein LTS12_014692 [Elasticomyces elasticus]
MSQSGAGMEPTQIAGDRRLENRLLESRLNEVAAEIKELTFAIKHKRDLLHIIGGKSPLVHHTTAAPARKVLVIPELAELIFANLDIRDSLSMMRVDRTSRDTILGSPILKKNLHLLPDTGAHLRLLPTSEMSSRLSNPFNNSVTIVHGHIHLLSVGLFGNPLQEMRRQHNHVTATFQHPLPRIGARVRSMQVSQPPIYEMEVRISCCDPPPCTLSPHFKRATRKVTHNRGLTLGALHYLAWKIMRQHRNCPFAGPEQHDVNGVVRAHVFFQAHVRLREDDPYVANKFAEYVTQVERRKEQARADGMMAKFCEKKRIAWAQGRPIPTFEEFSAATAGT